MGTRIKMNEPESQKVKPGDTVLVRKMRLRKFSHLLEGQ